MIHVSWNGATRSDALSVVVIVSTRILYANSPNSSARPLALGWKDDNGETLRKALFNYLIWALANDDPFALWRTLVLSVPEVVEELNEERWTLLTYACDCEPPDSDVISFLLKQFRGAARIKDQWHDTPLGVACNNNAPLKAIRRLLKANPRALSNRDYLGHTPLHRACSRGMALDGIQFLVKQQPSVCLRKNEHLCKVPLDDAMLFGNQDNVEFMTTATKAAANVLFDRLCFAGKLGREIFEQVAMFACPGPLAEVSMVWVELSMVGVALSWGEIVVLFQRKSVRNKFLAQIQTN